jgi:hypothetical protein
LGLYLRLHKLSFMLFPKGIIAMMLMCLSTIIMSQSYSLRFYGSGSPDIDRVKIPLDAPHRPVDVAMDFTLEFWMKAMPGENTSTACSQGLDWFYGNILVDRDIFGPGDHGDYGVALADRRIMVGVETVSGGSTLTFCGNSIVDDGLWHHVAITRRASDGLVNLFIDGQHDGTSGPNAHVGDISYRDGRVTGYPNSDPYLVLGAEKHDYPGSLYYRGGMDELRLSTTIRYTDVFSPPVAAFTPDAQTAALYHFDEGSGTTVGDAMGASPGFLSVGGNPTPGPVWSTDTPFSGGPPNLLLNGSFEDGLAPWVIHGGSGQLDNARARDGIWSVRLTSGELRYGLLGNLVPDSTYTLTAWFYLDPSSSGQDWGGIQMVVLRQDWQVIVGQFFTPYQRPVGHWFKEVVHFKAPPDGTVRLSLGTFGGPAWDLLYWVDDVRLFKQGPNMPPSFGTLQWPAGGQAPYEAMVTAPADDPDGAVVYKALDFGDGAFYTSLTDTFRHTYGTPGTYTIRAEILDNRGAMISEEYSLLITSAVGYPTIKITAPTPMPDWVAADSVIVLSGEVNTAQEELFWINERTMQHGWTSASAGSWSLPGISLAHGENVIAVQARDHQGRVVIDRIRVLRKEPSWTGPRMAIKSVSPATVPTYTLWEAKLHLESRGFDAFLPYGHLQGDTSGITLQAEFVRGADTLVQPAFYTVDHVPAGEDLAPIGDWYWALRMAFPSEGLWEGTLVAEDLSGRTELPLGAIQVTEGDEKGHIKVSDRDSRFFEYADGTPFYPIGYNISAGQDLPTLQQHLDDWSANGLNYGRFWLSAFSPFSDAWSSWATHHPMENIGYLPPSMITSERRFGRGDVSWKIAWPPVSGKQTPSMFRGFWSSVPVEPGRTYRLLGRVRLEQVEGAGGLVIKTGSWLGTDDVKAGTGVWLVESPLRGYSDWVYITGEWTAGSGDIRLPFIYLTLEDVQAGAVYLDQFTMHPLDQHGNPGPNVLDTWNANAHRYADPIECRKVDYLLGEAAQRDMHYQVVVFEKNDPLLNLFGPHGKPDPGNGRFEPLPDTYMDRLYHAYWRQLQARWGWNPAVAAWELVNEGAPGSYFDLLDRMADFFAEHPPYPRMTSTSFWSEWVPSFWRDSKAAYADVHAYIMTTGFLDGYTLDGKWYSREDLKRDPSLAIRAYGERLSRDPERNKPVIIGETDLDQQGNQAPDPLLAQDEQGIWLVDWIWGHLAAGGVSALIWDNANIEQNALHGQYRNYSAFIEGMDLANMPFFLPEVSGSDVRTWAFGQAPFDTILIWSRNQDYTWHEVLTQGLPMAVSGHIILTDLQPGQYLIEGWDPMDKTGSPLFTYMDTVLVDGRLELDVITLGTHRAWRVFYLGTISSTGNAVEAVDWQIWPNPVRDRIYIRAQGQGDYALLYLQDVCGRVVVKGMLSEGELDVNGLPPGTYFLILESSKGRVVEKVHIMP